MKALLKKYPLHSFLISLYMAMFLYAQNLKLVEMHMIYRTLYCGFLVSCLVYATAYFFVKEKTKAGIIASVIILTLFNYGVIYDFIENLYYQGFWPLKSIHRYLIAFLFVLIVSLIFFIKQKIIIGVRINYFLNLLLIFLVSFNILKIGVHKLSSKTKKIEIEKKVIILKSNKTEFKDLPNIYYMILDGYANQHVLKEFYRFDNSPFINFLKSKQFYIADSSFSNYYNTSQSLSATLNMDYESNTDSLLFDKLSKNKVMSELKKYGYTTIRLQSGYAVTNRFENIDSIIKIKAPNEFERSILKYTICRLDDIFGFIPYSRLKSQIVKLNDIVFIDEIGPKFVFIHIVAPHPPFVFSSKGERTFTKKDNDNSWEPLDKYIAQLTYINSVTKNFIENITKIDSSALFVLQSDHGPYITSKNSEDVFKARSMILNAIKYPNMKDYKSLYPSISSVNTFRSIFKIYLDSNYVLINDKTPGRRDLEMSSVFKSKIK